MKFLCGVAQGIHIVHISWLEKSEQKGAFLGTKTNIYQKYDVVTLPHVLARKIMTS